MNASGRLLCSLLLALAAGLPLRAEPAEPEVAHLTVGNLQITAFTVAPDSATVRIVSPQSNAYRAPRREDVERCNSEAPGIPDTQKPQSLPDAQRDSLIRDCLRQAVADLPDDRAAGAFLLDLANRHGALAILSGGYMESFEPPVGLGYLRVAGDELKRSHRSWLTTGMFCITGTTWRIVAVSPVAQPPDEGDCLQAGPFLVQDGQNRYRNATGLGDGEARLAVSSQDNAFLCIDDRGRLHLGHVHGGTTTEVAAALKDHLACQQALRLSGSITAGLWTWQDGLSGHNQVLLTNAIAVLALE
jgi:uncharacterized protein YigE (DUF2233 family)